MLLARCVVRGAALSHPVAFCTVLIAVALRSAVVRDERAWLFAGNGIMGDSLPQAELAEVRLKFRPLAEALGGGGVGA